MSDVIGSSRLCSQAATTGDDFPQPLEPATARNRRSSSDERSGRQIGNQFKAFAEAVKLMMKTQPNYSPDDSAQISVPVVIVHSEHDEFIRREHAEYLARTIPMPESPRHAITIQCKPGSLRGKLFNWESAVQK